MCPERAERALISVTTAYTTLFTSLVLGLVRLEKNVALIAAFLSFSFASSNSSRLSFSWPNAFTTLCPSTSSFVRAVCSPLATACSLKKRFVLDAMNFATRNESGVRMNTARAIFQFR